jgi:hypothetical protein
VRDEELLEHRHFGPVPDGRLTLCTRGFHGRHSIVVPSFVLCGDL